MEKIVVEGELSEEINKQVNWGAIQYILYTFECSVNILLNYQFQRLSEGENEKINNNDSSYNSNYRNFSRDLLVVDSTTH